MFDGSSHLILVASCILMGLSVGIGVFAVGLELNARGLTSEVARSTGNARRKRRSEPTGMLALAAPFLPISTALGRTLGLKSLRKTLADRYARAGYPGDLDDDSLVGLGLLLGVPLALPAVVLLSAVDLRLAPLGMLLLLVGPGLLSSNYNSRGNQRELSIARVMPFVLDLLVLTMRAGASLQQAIERVAGDYDNHPLGVEFSAVLTDLGTGLTNKQAFQNMRERVPTEPVGLFVDDLIQGEELGRPLADIFERQSDQARERRVQDATDTAGRAKVLVLIPGMLVFIAVLLLLFAPFFVRWYYGGLTVG
ncbi:MAG: Flp pilus assembly protein TadB [Planctomycetota bacterium]|jgi:Flp pilus assembly protein TadB